MQKVRRRRRIGLLQNACLEPPFGLPSVGRWRIGMLQDSCLESPFWLLSQKVGRRRRSRRLVRTNRGCPCARPIILGWRVDNAFLEPSSWLPSVCRRRIGCLQKVRRRRWIGLLQNACLEPFWLPSVGRRRIGLLQHPCLEPTFWLPSVGRWWIGQLRWSGPTAVAHAPVQLSWVGVLIAPCLGRRVVCFTFC